MVTDITAAENLEMSFNKELGDLEQKLNWNQRVSLYSILREKLNEIEYDFYIKDIKKTLAKQNRKP
mgnify:CR=1 FL=1